MSADTANVIAVQAVTHMKKFSYPHHSCNWPANIPGSIMPSDMNAVDIAKCAVGYLPWAKYIIYKVYAVKPKPYPNCSMNMQLPTVVRLAGSSMLM